MAWQRLLWAGSRRKHCILSRCPTSAQAGLLRCLASCQPPPTPHPNRQGWYFKVTLPGDGQSFALIYSIEDPAGGNRCAGVGAQVMGPDDGYLLQFSPQVGGCGRGQ